MRRAWLVMLAAAVAGCAVPSDEFRDNMWAGKYWYEKGRFGESMSAYRRALEERADYYPALVGLGNAAAEYSHEMYEKAADAFLANKGEVGAKVVQEADQWADLAHRSFSRAMQLRPDDAPAVYGHALFLFKRAVSRNNVPHPLMPEAPEGIRGTAREEQWKKGYAQRQSELSKSIEEFQMVLRGDPLDVGSVEHLPRCKSKHAHRYLGLALFIRSDWDRRDGDAGRQHLVGYLAYVRELRDMVIKRMPAQTPDQQAEKERRMKELERDLIDLKNIIRERLAALREYERQLRTSQEQPRLGPIDREKRLSAVTVEIDATTALVGEFDRASAPPRPDVPKPQGRP